MESRAMSNYAAKHLGYGFMDYILQGDTSHMDEKKMLRAFKAPLNCRSQFRSNSQRHFEAEVNAFVGDDRKTTFALVSFRHLMF